MPQDVALASRRLLSLPGMLGWCSASTELLAARSRSTDGEQAEWGVVSTRCPGHVQRYATTQTRLYAHLH